MDYDFFSLKQPFIDDDEAIRPDYEEVPVFHLDDEQREKELLDLISFLRIAGIRPTKLVPVISPEYLNVQGQDVERFVDSVTSAIHKHFGELGTEQAALERPFDPVMLAAAAEPLERELLETNVGLKRGFENGLRAIIEELRRAKQAAGFTKDEAKNLFWKLSMNDYWDLMRPLYDLPTDFRVKDWLLFEVQVEEILYALHKEVTENWKTKLDASIKRLEEKLSEFSLLTAARLADLRENIEALHLLADELARLIEPMGPDTDDPEIAKIKERMSEQLRNGPSFGSMKPIERRSALYNFLNFYGNMIVWATEELRKDSPGHKALKYLRHSPDGIDLVSDEIKNMVKKKWEFLIENPADFSRSLTSLQLRIREQIEIIETKLSKDPAAARLAELEQDSKFLDRKLTALKDGSESAGLNRFGSVNGNDATFGQIRRMNQNRVASSLSSEQKTGFLQSPNRLGSVDLREGNKTQKATSTSSRSTSNLGRSIWSSLRDSIYSVIASLALAMHSSMVSPIEQQPGSDGTDTEYPPSISFSRIILKVRDIILSLFFDQNRTTHFKTPFQTKYTTPQSGIPTNRPNTAIFSAARLAEPQGAETPGIIPQLEAWNLTPFSGENQDVLLRGIFDGDRQAEMVFAEDLFRLINANDPEALSRIQAIITQFPEDWREGLHQGAEGLNKNKRTIRIVLKNPLEYKDRQGHVQIFNEIQVTGILFTREILASLTRHYDYSAGTLPAEIIEEIDQLLKRITPEEIKGRIKKELDLLPQDAGREQRERDLMLQELPDETREEFQKLLQGRLPDQIMEQIGHKLKEVEFDPQGRPQFSDSGYPLLGAHGELTARKKFENARYVLPERGLRGPLVFGYGRFLGNNFEVDGKRLGIFVSLKRTVELPRLAKYKEETGKRMNEKTRLYLESLRLTSPGAFDKEMRIAKKDAYYPFNKAFPKEEYENILRSYGRALRLVLGENLADKDKILIPYKFPHMGNLAIDFTKPISGGGYEPVWYDLGGWKSGKEMTKEQAFSYVYYTLSYGLREVAGHVAQEGSDFNIMYKLKLLDPVKLFLEGFFYDQLQNPEFQKWQVNDPGFSDLVKNTFFGHLNEPSLPPPYLRTNRPYVLLLKKMMDMDQSQDEEKIRDVVQQWVTGSKAVEVVRPDRFKAGPATKQIVTDLLQVKGPFKASHVNAVFQKNGLSFKPRQNKSEPSKGDQIARELNGVLGRDNPVSIASIFEGARLAARSEKLQEIFHRQTGMADEGTPRNIGGKLRHFLNSDLGDTGRGLSASLAGFLVHDFQASFDSLSNIFSDFGQSSSLTDTPWYRRALGHIAKIFAFFDQNRVTHFKTPSQPKYITPQPGIPTNRPSTAISSAARLADGDKDKGPNLSLTAPRNLNGARMAEIIPVFGAPGRPANETFTSLEDRLFNLQNREINLRLLEKLIKMSDPDAVIAGSARYLRSGYHNMKERIVHIDKVEFDPETEDLINTRPSISRSIKDIDVILKDDNIDSREIFIRNLLSVIKTRNDARAEIIPDVNYMGHAIKLIFLSPNTQVIEGNILIDFPSRRLLKRLIDKIQNFKDFTHNKYNPQGLIKSYFIAEYYVGNPEVYRRMVERFHTDIQSFTSLSDWKSRIIELQNLIQTLNRKEITDKILAKQKEAIDGARPAVENPENIQKVTTVVQVTNEAKPQGARLANRSSRRDIPDVIKKGKKWLPKNLSEYKITISDVKNEQIKFILRAIQDELKKRQLTFSVFLIGSTVAEREGADIDAFVTYTIYRSLLPELKRLRIKLVKKLEREFHLDSMDRIRKFQHFIMGLQDGMEYIQKTVEDYGLAYRVTANNFFKMTRPNPARLAVENLERVQKITKVMQVINETKPQSARLLADTAGLALSTQRLISSTAQQPPQAAVLSFTPEEKALLRDFSIGLAASRLAIDGRQVAVGFDSQPTPSIFDIRFDGSKLELLYGDEVIVSIEDYPSALQEWRNKLTAEKAQNAESEGARALFKAVHRRMTQGLVNSMELNTTSFVAMNLSQINEPLKKEKDFKEALRLIFQIMNSKPGNYYLANKGSLSPDRQEIVNNLILGINKETLRITEEYPGPSASVTWLRFTKKDAFTQAKLAHNETELLIAGFENGQLPNLEALWIARDISQIYAKHSLNGKVPSVQDQDRYEALLDELGRSGSFQLFKGFFHGKLDSKGFHEFLTGLMPLGQRSEWILPPITAYLNDLAQALKLIRQSVDVSA